MTGSLVVNGIARVQYVNAAAATDEWPPKYWKARSPNCPGKALLCVVVERTCQQQVIDRLRKSGHAHKAYPPAVRGLLTVGKAQPVLHALPDFTCARHLVLAQTHAINACVVVQRALLMSPPYEFEASVVGKYVSF